MTSFKSRREPVFNVPGVVTALLAIMVAIQLARQFLDEQTAEWLVLALAFIPDRYMGHAAEWPGGEISAWITPVTHMLVHGDWTHLALNGASLLAFGGIVARRISVIRFLAFAVFSGVCGAALFLVLNHTVEAPMVGASGAISGLMAAALRLLFSAIDAAPPGGAGELVRHRADLIPLAPLRRALADSRMRSATAMWILMNALAAYGLGTPQAAGAIAWEAHIGGYLAGLLAYGWFDPVAKSAPSAGESAS